MCVWLYMCMYVCQTRFSIFFLVGPRIIPGPSTVTYCNVLQRTVSVTHLHRYGTSTSTVAIFPSKIKMIFFIFHSHTYVDYVDRYQFLLFLKSFQQISKNVHLLIKMSFKIRLMMFTTEEIWLQYRLILFILQFQ